MNVLVVDDSRAMRAFIRGVLRQAFDCVPREASSGFEALRWLPREDYDVVVADVNMPDINGLELVRFIRRSGRQPDVPVLVISTLNSSRDRERIDAVGASDFLAKPFTPEQLTGAIQRLVGADGGAR